MKLYKIVVWESPNEPYKLTTRYVGSQAEIKQHTHKQKHFGVWEATIKDRITKQDLIDLLEGDSPGTQPQKMTPVDLVTDLTLIKEKG